MSQMMSGMCDRFNVLALPLIPMIILSQLQLVPDKVLLIVYVCFLTVAHLHYGVNLVRLKLIIDITWFAQFSYCI